MSQGELVFELNAVALALATLIIRHWHSVVDNSKQYTVVDNSKQYTVVDNSKQYHVVDT